MTNHLCSHGISMSDDCPACLPDAPPRATRTQARILLGLSAVSTGLTQIEGGQLLPGIACAKQGVEYLRGLLGERT